ncbi:MAG: DUF1846 family protein, partial [Oscillospiraceae bacterium]|nr:DUF1846 family protein [Oscillospiraceae bacterium]
KDEIIRRYFSVMCEKKLGGGSENAVNKVELLMNQAGVTPEERAVVGAALLKSETSGGEPAIAIELPDGRLVTGRNTPLLGPSASALLNAIKVLAGIEDSVYLIPPEVIEPIQKLKTEILGNGNPRLHSDEVLIALTVAASQNSLAAVATKELSNLRNCEAHSTVILSQVDLDVYRKLGINMTCEPRHQTKKLYHR